MHLAHSHLRSDLRLCEPLEEPKVDYRPLTFRQCVQKATDLIAVVQQVDAAVPNGKSRSHPSGVLRRALGVWSND